jgi:hypothetical protein
MHNIRRSPCWCFVSPTSEFSVTCVFRSPSVAGLEPRRASSCSSKVDVWLFGGLDTQSTQVYGRFILLCCVGGGRQCCNHSLTSLCNLALDLSDLHILWPKCIYICARTSRKYAQIIEIAHK